jgi:hypothetical protein
MAIKTTLFCTFTEHLDNDHAGTQYFRLHVPWGFLGSTDLGLPAGYEHDPGWSTCDWAGEIFPLSGGYRKQYGFHLDKKPSQFHVYTRELLLKRDGDVIQFLEGSAFMQCPTQSFCEGLARMFIL